jgi:predicted Ser/Thr protein kinase
MAKRADREGGTVQGPTASGNDLALGDTAPHGGDGAAAEPDDLAATLDLPGVSPVLAPSAGATERGPTVDPASGEHSGILGAALDSSSGDSRPLGPSASQSGVFPVASWSRYEFLGLLGRGGMGSVYKAMDRRIHRLVALKFVRGDDEHLIKRFLQEARSQARIDHPGICKVLEVGEVEGKPYIAMQFVDGQSLQQAKQALSQDEKILLIKESAEALHAAHQAGILHRDIKPANIMIEKRSDGAWHPVVMDFGIARDSNDTGITESGTVLGTAAYMSPEQARGEVKRLDRRTDVYSLGATLFDLLAGRPPFVAASTADMLLMVMMEEPPALRKLVPTVPESIDTVVNKCLAKEALQRYQTAQELADDLGRCLAKESIVGGKVSLVSRLRWKARHNRSLAVAATALVFTLLLLIAYGVRTRLQTARMARQAKEQTEQLRHRAELQAQLTQRLGQEISKMEWLLRSARQLPIHDLEREKGMVRQRMATLQSELHGYGELAAGLAHYAIGRGHLALHEYAESLAELRLAQKAGQDGAELHYALGVVLGKHYELAMQEARMSGGGDWAKKQLQEIAPRYLTPALASLDRARAQQSDTAHYLEALISYYQRDDERALQQIAAARQEAPWLYEAVKLTGDIHHERALAARDSGKDELAKKEFAAAVSAYEEAAEIGRSDAEVYEGLAETWIRQIEMAVLHAQATDQLFEHAVAASDKISRTESRSVQGSIKKAFAAVMTVSLSQAANSGSIEKVQLCLDESRKVLAKVDDPYARDLGANCYRQQAEFAVAQGRDPVPLLQQAIALLEPATLRHPRFLWGLNDLAGANLELGMAQWLRGDREGRSALAKALTIERQAAALDEGYYIALQNLIFIQLGSLPVWEREEELHAALEEVDAVYGRCLKINSQYQQCHLNYGEVYARAAQRTLLAGGDAQARLARGLASLATARKLGDQFLDLEQYTVLAHWVDAALHVKRKQDPAPALKELRAALRRCEALGKTDAMCRTLAAQAYWVEADWLRLHGKAAIPALQQALTAAIFATQSPEVYPDAGQVLAETYHRLAQTTVGLTRRQHLAAGQVALQKVFAVNPNHAAGWATQGALTLLRAEAERGIAQQELVKAALAAIDKAESLDPMLKSQLAPLRNKASLSAMAR